MQGWIAYLRFVFIYMRSWEIVLSIIMPATLEGLYPVPMKIWPGPMKIWSQSAGSAHLNATSNIKCHPMTNCMCTIRNIKSKCWWPIENEPQRSNLLNSRWQLRGSVTNSFLAFFTTPRPMFEKYVHIDCIPWGYPNSNTLVTKVTKTTKPVLFETPESINPVLKSKPDAPKHNCSKAYTVTDPTTNHPNRMQPPLDRHWDIPQPKYQLRRPLSNSRLLKYIFSQILYQRDDKYKYFTLRTKCCLIHRNCRAFDKWFSI